MQHRYGFASTGQFVSRSFVVLLRKSIPQNHNLQTAAELGVMRIWKMNQTSDRHPKRQADIEAEIYFLRTVEGGRKTAVHSGYRPTHNFGISGMLNDAHHEYIESNIIELGKTVNALLWFLCPEYQNGRLYIGMEFSVQEGSKIVGRGKIKNVINIELLKVA